MIKKIRYITILLILFCTCNFLFNTFDNRLIKFERYNNKNFDILISKLFPIGSNANVAIEKLIKLRLNFKIHKINKKDKYEAFKWFSIKDIDYVLYFKYRAPLLSIAPLTTYSVDVYVDKNQKIIGTSTLRQSFFQYYWW